jgi:hypothetical protein
VLARDNQDVHGRCRVNVGEGVPEVVLVDGRGGNGSFNDLAKKAAHNETSVHALFCCMKVEGGEISRKRATQDFTLGAASLSGSLFFRSVFGLEQPLYLAEISPLCALRLLLLWLLILRKNIPQGLRPYPYIAKGMERQVPGSGVPAVFTLPAATCGSGDPQDSRPGGRRYSFADKFFIRLRRSFQPSVKPCAFKQHLKEFFGNLRTLLVPQPRSATSVLE